MTKESYLVWFEKCIQVDAYDAEQALKLAREEFNKGGNFEEYVEKETVHLNNL